MTNREAQLETMEQNYRSHEIIFLRVGYTHKTLPLNVKVMSAFSVSVCVEGTVGGGRGGGGRREGTH